MYDYLLGGKDNYAADRAAAEEVVRRAPDTPFMARQNRAFLHRAVLFLAEAGIRQFIDIGAGLPTQGNVHEIAQQVAPDAKVVYVDNDPVVLTHGRALLGRRPGVVSIQADARSPDEILGHPELLDLIDLNEPVAVLMLAVLHFIDDCDEPHGIVSYLRDAMAPGSHLVISHVTADHELERVREASSVYEKATSRITLRSHSEVSRFFTGFDLVNPGLTTLSLWRPTSPRAIPPGAEQQWCYAGVGRKAGR